MILLDTWAWIEYFNGTSKGSKVKETIEKTQVYTSIISLAEISKWVYKNEGNLGPIIKQINVNSIVIDLEEEILIESGRRYNQIRKSKKEIGLIDVIIYTTANIHSLKLLTGDPDFEGLEGVEML